MIEVDSSADFYYEEDFDMGLKDELNAASRDKSVVRDEQYKKDYEEGVSNATKRFSWIQDELIEKVKNGDYKELVNGKKLVQTFYKEKFSTIAFCMGLRISMNKIQYKSIGFFTGTVNNVKYLIESQGRYDGFVKRFMELALKEDVSFKIICRYERDGKLYEFNPVVGAEIPGGYISESLIDFGIECSVEY